MRQLAYGYRNWETLEAVGRSGDDGGRDIRGIEASGRDRDADSGFDPEVEDTDGGAAPRT